MAVPSSVISDRTFEEAVRSVGVSAPSTAKGCADARAAVGQVSYKVLRRLLDALRLITTARTVQPEHVHNLATLSALLETNLAASPNPRSRRGRMVGGHAGTVMASSFFGMPENASYTASIAGDAAGGGGHDLIRAELPASSAFPVSGGGVRRKTFSWLPEEALEALLREYRARSAPDLRVSESARGLLRMVIETNVEAALRAAGAKSSTKKKCVSAAPILKAGDAMKLLI